MSDDLRFRFPPPARRGGLLAACLLAGACAWPSAEAARPMETDDAAIVDEGACQVESWMRFGRSQTEFWALPGCNVSGNVEVTLGGALTHEHGDRTRYSDTVFQVKGLFRRMEPGGWGTGLVLGTAHQARVGGGNDWYAYVPTSLSFREGALVVHTNLGWTREQDVGRGRMRWGLGGEAKLAGRTWLIAEVYGQNRGRPFYQVGVRHWLVKDRLQLDTTYGSRAGRSGEERWVSVGLRWLSDRLLP